MTCSSWSQTCMAASDGLSHILAVAFIFLCIVYMAKAKHVNGKLQQLFAALRTIINAGKGHNSISKND